jgi:hypothetical protein
MTAGPVSPIASVFAGARCVGFLFRRGGAGIEAFDEYRRLGLYADQAEGIAAVAGCASRDSARPSAKKNAPA